MGIVVNGVTYYRFRGVPVIASNGDPLENLTGIQVFYTGTSTPLTVLEFATQSAVTTVASGPYGMTGDYWVPAQTAGVIPDVVLDHPDDVFPAQPWDAHPNEWALVVQSLQASLASATNVIDPATGRIYANLLPTSADGGTTTHSHEQYATTATVNALTDRVVVLENEAVRGSGWDEVTRTWSTKLELRHSAEDPTATPPPAPATGRDAVWLD